MIDFTGKSDRQKADIINSHVQRMKNRRKPYDNLTDICNRLFLPRRYDILRESRPGQQYGANIYDGHPANAANKHAIGFLSYMVSKAVPWLDFSTRDQDMMNNDDVKQYMQDAQEQVLWSFNQTNFYGSSLWYAKDKTVSGIAYAVPEENLVTGNIVYQTMNPGRCYVEDDQFGVPSVFATEIKLTAIKQLQKFGKSKMTARGVQNANGKDPFTEDSFIFYACRNPSYYEGSSRPEDKPVKIWYVRQNSDAVTSPIALETGMDWFPLVWSHGKEPGQSYATSLAADALTEALQVNKLGEKSLEAAHKAVDPALVLNKGLRNGLNSHGFTTRAGGRNWVNSDTQPADKMVKEVFSKLNWPISDAQMERLHDSLDDKFFIRFFEMMTSRDLPGNITAFQINQMISEKAVLMGAMVGGFENDYLSQAVDVQFAHEENAGRMPDPPDILLEEGEGRVETRYSGPLARMQKSALLSKPIVDGLGIMQGIIETWPSAAIKINEMELIEDAGISFGWQQSLFKRDEEVKEILAQENAKAAQAEAMDQANALAGNAGQLGKAVEPNSILSTLGGQ